MTITPVSTYPLLSSPMAEVFQAVLEAMQPAEEGFCDVKDDRYIDLMEDIALAMREENFATFNSDDIYDSVIAAAAPCADSWDLRERIAQECLARRNNCIANLLPTD